jgi:iron complex outermembrane receptor protein
MKRSTQAKSVLLAATALSIGCATPAFAQNADANKDEPATGNAIIVTAQRIEQRLQDVPISITVLDESKIANNNIQSAKDIAAYTPGLTTNNRYGSDNTTWAIRGFTQERLTTATVGTYFADVVAPRGSGTTQGGDGAGPGALFDLQNIQVLKGPQGTLFGRNSTGGAVLLVPKKPTRDFEGYVEGSAGQLNMYRIQAVVNVPFGDSFRIRLGLDRNKRDGYLKNTGNLGSGLYGKDMGSTDYWAARLSAVADLSPDVENYTILSYSNSKSTGVSPKLTQCSRNVTLSGVTTATVVDPVTRLPVGGLATGATIADIVSVVVGGQSGINQTNYACSQIVREQATGAGFFQVENPVPDAGSMIEQWQFINTTTIRASDALTIKNIFSYGEFRGKTNLDLFGAYWPVTVPADQVTSGLQVMPLNFTHAEGYSGHTNAESSMVEELQFQGNSSNGKLNWQAGLYLEVNSPLGKSGSQTVSLTPCADVTIYNCLAKGTLTGGTTGSTASFGSSTFSVNATTFVGKAIYAQASYDLTDQLKLTGGIRYTQDRMRSRFQVESITLGAASSAIGPTTAFATCTNTLTWGAANTATNPRNPIDQRYGMCLEEHTVTTSAPTWLLGLDFKPSDNILLYAKYSRGYRQGGVAAFGPDKLQDYKAEKVDTYEVGAKTSWRGAMPGSFNISGFYNDFRDQQLQVGLQCLDKAKCSNQTTVILNAGKSRLYGLETELTVSPFEGLQLEAAYAYLNARITKIANPVPLIASSGLPFDDVRPVSPEMTNAIPHKLTLSARYTLPLPESVGKLTFGGTFIYQSRYRVTSDDYFGNQSGFLPSSRYGNVNVTWQDVGGMPIDAAFFVTNVTNAQTYLHVNVQTTSGFRSYVIGEPRIWGARIKYRF